MSAFSHRSSVDIVKIASETIEGLFNMRLALPVALVRALTEGLDEVLRKCAFHHRTSDLVSCASGCCLGQYSSASQLGLCLDANELCKQCSVVLCVASVTSSNHDFYCWPKENAFRQKNTMRKL